MGSDARRPHLSDQVQLTARDVRLLAFVAEHRLVRMDHIECLLGASRSVAYARAAALCQARLLRRSTHFHREPGCLRITPSGLAAIGSDLPRLGRDDLQQYAHDLGVAWLWLAARDGRFGALRAFVGERRMRSEDGRRDRPGPPFAVRAIGPGPRGGERRHYPDLLLETPSGRRVAVELELTPKGRERLERILLGYGAEPRIDAVLYLVSERRIAVTLAAAARRVGVEDLVHVRMVAPPGARGASPAGARALARGRAPEHGR